MNKLSDLKFEIRESLYRSMGLIVFDSLLIAFGIFSRESLITRLGLSIYIFILTCALSFLAYKIYALVQREVIMIIDSNGIYHKNYKLIRWDDILWIKRARLERGETTILFFMIQTTLSTQPYEIAISDLDSSEKSLTNHIRKFRAFHINEFDGDEL